MRAVTVVRDVAPAGVAFPRALLRTGWAASVASSSLGVALLGVALSGCTLTQDDFEPTRTESSPVLPDEGAPAPVPAGTPCTTSVECPAGFDCSGSVCVQSACVGTEDVAACVAQTCLGGVCPEGSACIAASDCATGVCTGGLCVAPSCSDGVVNQGESGPDCGGASCPRCAAGVSCAADSDCAEGLVCPATAPRTCSPPSCQDGVRSGEEADVDCGGPCSACPSGSACASAADCVSAACVEGACAEASCSDQVANGDETDVDCGGSCTPCAVGLGCAGVGDCQSAVCAAVGCGEGVAQCCQAPTCADGVRNGDESSIDCGSAPCEPCAVGATCTAAAQCETNVCGAEGACVALCANQDQDGDESDVDCGGSETGCARCEDGAGCAADADCESGICDQGECASCTDGVQSGDEDGVDCGGSEPGCPVCIRCTEENSLSLGTAGSVTTLTGNACAQIITFPGYAPSVVEGVDDGPYPLPFSWSQECTGESGSDVFDRQFQQLRIAGLSTGCPVIFDLGGTAAGFSMRWY